MELLQENLRDKIAELYSSEVLESEKRYYGAHGTPTKEIAEQILKEGIVTMHRGDLGRTCMALSEDSGKTADILLNYEHRQPLKYIAIVSYKSGIRDHQIIEEEVPELMAKAQPGYESFHQHVHRIPPQFVKGYFDVEAGKFIKNPSYVSAAEPVTARKSQFPQVNLQDLGREFGAKVDTAVTDTNPDDWVEDFSGPLETGESEAQADDWNF